MTKKIIMALGLLCLSSVVSFAQNKRTAVVFDDFVTHRKADSAAAFLAFALVKLLFYFFQLVFRDARSVVTDADHKI